MNDLVQRAAGGHTWQSYASFLTLVLLGLGLGGCTSLGKIYVHDDSAQKAAETAQSDWGTADPVKVLAGQKDYFAHLASDEAATVRSSIDARRDLQLIALMRGDKAAFANLRNRIDPLTGGIDLTKRQNLQGLASLDEKISQFRTAQDLNAQALADARRKFTGDGFHDDVSDCSKIVAPPLSPALTDLRDADIALIKSSCDDLSRTIESVDLVLKNAQGVGASELGNTLGQLTSLQTQLDTQNAQAKALSAKLASLKTQVDQAKDSKAADLAKSALKFCGADPKSSATSAAAAPSNAATLQSALPECVTQLAKDADPIVNLVKHSFLASEIQSALTAALNANSAATTNSPKPADANVAASTTTALRTLGFLAGAADNIEANRQPSVNALLVALAYEQHEVTMNQLAAQTLQERMAILQEKREALISEISHLARALESYDLARSDTKNDTVTHERLAKGTPGAGRILTEVASSWSVGRYRVELADYADIDLIRQDSLRTASEVAGSWKNVLQPAFDELVAYGKGGLDAQTTAALATAVINAGGFAAVAARIGK